MVYIWSEIVLMIQVQGLNAVGVIAYRRCRGTQEGVKRQHMSAEQTEHGCMSAGAFAKSR